MSRETICLWKLSVLDDGVQRILWRKAPSNASISMERARNDKRLHLPACVRANLSA